MAFIGQQRQQIITGPKPVYFENEQDVELYYPKIQLGPRRGLKPVTLKVEARPVVEVAKFQPARTLSDVTHRQQRRLNQVIEKELAEASQVLLEARREKLRKFLNDEYNELLDELAAKGLAIYN